MSLYPLLKDLKKAVVKPKADLQFPKSFLFLPVVYLSGQRLHRRMLLISGYMSGMEAVLSSWYPTPSALLGYLFDKPSLPSTTDLGFISTQVHPPSSSLSFAHTGKNPWFGAFQPGSDQDLVLPAEQPQSHWQHLLRCPGSFSRTAELISACPHSSAISQRCLSYQLCPFCLQGNLGGFCMEERDSLPTFPQRFQTVLAQNSIFSLVSSHSDHLLLAWVKPESKEQSHRNQAQKQRGEK